MLYPPSRPLSRSAQKNPRIYLVPEEPMVSSYVSPIVGLNLTFLRVFGCPSTSLRQQEKGPFFLDHSPPCHTTSKTSGPPSYQLRAATVTMGAPPLSRYAETLDPYAGRVTPSASSHRVPHAEPAFGTHQKVGPQQKQV